MESCPFFADRFQNVKLGSWEMSRQQSPSQRTGTSLLRVSGEIILGYKRRAFVKSWKTWSVQSSEAVRESDLPRSHRPLDQVNPRPRWLHSLPTEQARSWLRLQIRGSPGSSLLQLQPPSPWSVGLAPGEMSYSWSAIERRYIYADFQSDLFALHFPLRWMKM